MTTPSGRHDEQASADHGPRPAPHGVENVDARALERALKDRVKGEVRFDDGSRALYSTDASNYRQVPIGVVIPKDANDVVETVRAARAHGAPILGRGGGTSLAGQCCNVALVIDFSKYMNRVLAIDPVARTAKVQPGLVLDALRDATKEHDLTFGPDPATHNRCTLGGMLGNNSCGVHSQMAGRTVDNVESLKVLTYDGHVLTVGATSDEEYARLAGEPGRRGEIYTALQALRDRLADRIRDEYPDIPRRVSGFPLDELLPENGFHVARALVGTESTCVIVLEATLKLVDRPKKRSLLVIGYDDVAEAGDDVPDVARFGPVGLEGMDGLLVEYARKKHLHVEDIALLPEGRACLLVEFGGDTVEDAERQARRLVEHFRSRGKPDAMMKIYQEEAQVEGVWRVRESGLGATARVPGAPDTWPGWEDSAVDPAQVGDYLRDLQRLLAKYGYEAALYGHFGQGCVHTRIPFDLQTADGIAQYRAFAREAAELCVKYGGSLSGEHGDGQARGELLPVMYSREIIDGFREFKRIWDPEWKMNPGKVVDPFPMDANLRLGTAYAPTEPETAFAYPEDDGKFSRATLRCVGVGLCRRDSGGVMCPSYMVTKEEKHSTRGRARLLFEMLQGDPVSEGWKSDAVEEALDLCLACKGCKTDCPVNVDMATYKAEFRSHYYDGRLRPRHAYAFGLIHRWARLASKLPRVANFSVRAPGLGALAKKVAGIHPAREAPAFARQTFRAWFADREPRNPDGERVLLWPDTFNNHFHPEVGQAATDVLEEAGYRVVIPPRILCCGRPLYDYGFLDRARALLEEILTTLQPEIERGTPIVGMEPSCVATFRDELPNLLHDNADAHRLKAQVVTLPEFLTRHAKDWRPPRVGRNALLHGHCHHKSLWGLDADRELLDAMDVTCTVPDSGCCGMAGGFGFEKAHYDVAVAAGERVLLPAVRDQPEDALVVTDGFSCREQVRQGAGRRAHHLAEVVRLGLIHEGRVSERIGR